MLRSSESETEILLGNKQLLGIFFLVAVLIGVAFGGGYMLGRGAGDKKAAGPAAPVRDTAAAPGTANPTAGETRTVSPSDTAVTDAGPEASDQADQAPLGSPRHKSRPQPGQSTPGQSMEVAPPEAVPVNFTPQDGQEFLQVAAVPRGEASGIADVLRKKGFPAHTVPVPGNAKLYRVIVGPIRDVADLSATREQLRKTGFGKVIVQKY